MRRMEQSSRIKEIEQTWQKPIKALFYDWHWKDNLKHSQIGEKVNVPRPTITRWFKKFDIPSQPCARFTNLNLLNVGPRKTPPAKPKVRKPKKWIVNEKFFDQWSPEMAYILGFFCADGSMSKNRRGAHFIELAIADYDLLVKMKAFLGTGHKISVRKIKGKSGFISKTWRFQIGSKRIFKSLVALGVTPKKSYRIRIPSVPKAYLADFIRGYFDGDGGVWCGCTHKKDRKSSSKVLVSTFTSCSRGMLQDIAHYLYEMADTRLQKVIFRDGAFRLHFSTCDSRKIYYYIYNNKNDLFLKRKKDIFEKYLRA